MENLLHNRHKVDTESMWEYLNNQCDFQKDPGDYNMQSKLGTYALKTRFLGPSYLPLFFP